MRVLKFFEILNYLISLFSDPQGQKIFDTWQVKINAFYIGQILFDPRVRKQENKVHLKLRMQM